MGRTRYGSKYSQTRTISAAVTSYETSKWSLKVTLSTLMPNLLGVSDVKVEKKKVVIQQDYI